MQPPPMRLGADNNAGAAMTTLRKAGAAGTRLPTLWVRNDGPTWHGLLVDSNASGILSRADTEFGVWGTGATTGVAGHTPLSVAFDTARTDFPPGVWGAGPVGVYGAVPVPSPDGTRPVREGCAGVVGRGEARGSHGVRGVAHNRGNGVVGDVDTGGVVGVSAGVIGTARQLNGNGVIGDASNGINANGVWGRSSSGYGGKFSTYGTGGTARALLVVGDSLIFGDVQVFGQINKDAVAFKIDHPLDPENKYLFHSGVESPDMKNVYDGIAQLDEDGGAWVELPEWFGELNRDHRYQLTALGEPAPDLHIAEEISENRFRIAGGTAGMKVSWQVTGVRKDGWAERNRIVVEEDKPEEARGTYLHPEAFGQPETRGEYYSQEEEWSAEEEELRSRQEERIASEEEHRRVMEELRQRMERQAEEAPPEST